MYHRVLPQPEAERLAVEPGMYVTPETFARHLEWLAARFRVLPVAELVRALQEGRSLPRGACGITFDDGWRDFHRFAWPLLTRRQLPATVFLVTERVGTRGAFWSDEVCRRLRAASAEAIRALGDQLRPDVAEPISEGSWLAWLQALEPAARERALEAVRRATPEPEDPGRELLDWSEVDEAARRGIDFESHGSGHTLLTELSPDAARRDLARSLATLRERGLARDGLLAYPGGAHDDAVVAAAAAAGYRAAFTTRPGICSAGDPALRLPRVALHEDVAASAAEFHERVPGPHRPAGS
jgi:peptidoglycan/xylan/chitin deacetylase (PgdA/CDA1 family)